MGPAYCPPHLLAVSGLAGGPGSLHRDIPPPVEGIGGGHGGHVHRQQDKNVHYADGLADNDAGASMYWNGLSHLSHANPRVRRATAPRK